jgi:hypothetical protein
MIVACTRLRYHALAFAIASSILFLHHVLIAQVTSCPGCYTQASDPRRSLKSGLGIDPSTGQAKVKVCRVPHS